MEEEEERYVKLAASRFFRVKPTRGGGAMPRRLHYLESCFLCKEAIACNRDIFMYKGDAAFCSEDCRQDQMDMDEALHHRFLRMPPPPPSSLAEAPQMMRRRPTIANLAPRNPPAVAAS